MKRYIAGATLLVLLSGCTIQSAPQTDIDSVAQSVPQLDANASTSIDFVSLDRATLAYHKAQLSETVPALMQLIKTANKALQKPIDPVTNKTLLPASGDIHDYFSFGTYWWPNPDTDNGLPYVNRDGQTNPATRTAATDKRRFVRFGKDVTALALAYYFTNNTQYAEKARQLLNAWHVDPATRMNPNLRHAQAIPGRVDGRGVGLIDSRFLIGVMDSVELLKSVLTPNEHQAIVSWYRELTGWMLSSDNGYDEEKARNNHGTWYDAQIVALLMFIGEYDQAKMRIESRTKARVRSQFDSDGAQPLELKRTRPWHYSNFNLQAYSKLAVMADKLGVDLWGYHDNQASLQQGYRFIAEYVVAPERWPLEEVRGFDTQIAYSNLLYASKAYDDPLFENALAQLRHHAKSNRDVHNLLVLNSH
ncbi:alginate lyase family protein [Neiella marina]|uniref:Alginate lyase family protein n=1 Tax=Neiella holothuriorum TaxID=2870530 RepID=A0ABS7EC81_9GAMM|nr:alginate lyase family protein [Neiella holothuriorum]MBW8189855.1 alginate lyase family protein [Neiella holothuriorum]